MKNIIKKSFELENIRAKLARQKKYTKLLETYNKLNPHIPDLNTSRLWDQLNSREKISSEENPMAYDRLITISKIIRCRTGNVLNIGFGNCDLESIFLPSCKKISWMGIDISQHSVIRAQKNFPKAKFSVGDIRKLKFPNESFHCVLAIEVLEHIVPSDILKALKEVYRVVKREGNFIVSVPLNEGLDIMLESGFNLNAHVRVYTPELIQSELELVGFKILKNKKLYAFTNYYRVKTFIVNNFLKSYRNPNNIIVIAQKP